jgi:hypothetical protein
MAGFLCGHPATKPPKSKVNPAYPERGDGFSRTIWAGSSAVFPFLSSLGWYWLIAPLVVAVAGGLTFFRSLGHLMTGEPGRASAKVIIGAPLAIIGCVLGLLGLNTQTFARLTYEAPVADVSVKTLDASQGTYRVTVNRLDGPKVTMTCDL